MNLMACVFKRDKASDWEDGILIDEGELIIDMQGKPVEEPIWNYQQLAHQLCVNYESGYAKAMKK